MINLKSVKATAPSEITSDQTRAYASYTSWVSQVRIRARLDASFYAPKYLELDEALDKFEQSQIDPLGKFLKAPRRVLYMNTQTYEAHNAPQNSIPFVSGVDLEQAGCSLNWSTPLYVDGWMAEKYPKGLLFPGALLIKVKGPNQSATYVETLRRKALVSGTIFFSGTFGIDPFYLVAFLCSSYGTNWRTRLRTNLTVEFVSNEDLKELPVLKVNETSQRAIGNILRKSARLRELADRSKIEATTSLDTFLQWPINLPLGNANFVSNDDVFTSRLDSKFYLPAYLEVIHHLRSLPGGCRPMSELLDEVFNGCEVRDFVEEGRPYLCVKDINEGRLDVHGAPKIQLDTSIPKKALIKTGDVLVVRTGSLGQAAFIRPVEEQSGAAISSHFIRLVLREKAQAPVLAAFLNSTIGKLLQEQIAYGAVQPQVSQDDVGCIPVPNWPDDLEKSIGEAQTKWRDYLDEAEKLVECAKDKVESAIAGRLDEGRLVAESAEIEKWLTANPSPYASK